MPEIDQKQETPTFRRFVDDEFYPPNHPLMRLFGSPGSLAVQRCKRRGPPFMRYGRRILYSGRDLNAILDSSRVETAA